MPVLVVGCVFGVDDNWQEVAHVRLLTLPYKLSGWGAACYSASSSGVLSES
jgi:hypothetical protein